MGRFIYILLALFSFATIGCGEKSVMDIPVSASSFRELTDKLETLCDKTDNQTCGYVNGAVYVHLPDYKSDKFIMNAENEAIIDKLFKKLNGKTPNEIIEIYKAALLDNLDKLKRHDEEIVQNLDHIKATFEKTKHFANDVSVSRISVDFRKKSPVIAFDVSNNTKFNLKQIVSEIDFFTASETFLGREKAFSYTLFPILKPGQTQTIKVSMISIKDADLTLIRAAKNLKIKVLISSVQTDDPKADEAVLVLALPASYHKMRELIKESNKLYNDTVSKIKSINKK